MRRAAMNVTVLALAAAALAAGPAGVARADDAKAVELDVVLPVTGMAAFLGKSEQQGMQLVEKQVNAAGGIKGHLLHLVFQDDQSNPQVAVQLTSAILANRPPIIMGSALVAMCNAMAPLVKNGPVMYCLSPGLHPAPGSWAFSCSLSTADLAQAAIRYFRARGWTRLAVMTSTDASGQDADRGIDGVLAMPEFKDVTIVAREHFNTADVSVSAQIENIKAARPQAFIAWSTGTPVATIFKGITEAGLDIPVATTDGNMTWPQMTRYADFLPKQLYFPSGVWVAHDSRVALPAAVKAAQDRFYAAYAAAGVKPDVASAHGWDPTMIVADAFKALGPGASAAQLHDYLEHLDGYAGVNGVYDFRRVPQRGLDVHNVVVSRWDGAAKGWTPVSEPAGLPLKD